MHFEIITLFPEFFEGFFGTSIVGRAREKGRFTENRIQLRRFALNRYGQVDDEPYGGGMVLRPEPATSAIEEALRNCEARKRRVIFFTPQGRPLTQHDVRRFAREWEALVLLCGHYKGLDERVIERSVDEEISVGDYVLTGGELPAMIFMDALIRLLEDVLGDKRSAEGDSFYKGLLEGPLYTRPEVFEGSVVPEVLKCGDPKRIADWSLEQALRRTVERRPDLLKETVLNEKEEKLLKKIKELPYASTH